MMTGFQNLTSNEQARKELLQILDCFELSFFLPANVRIFSFCGVWFIFLATTKLMECMTINHVKLLFMLIRVFTVRYIMC